MTTTGLNHYNLRAPRELLEALRAFYCDVVGLKVGPRPAFPSIGYWLYAGNDAVLHLVEAAPGDPHTPHTQGTFDHAAFTCTDFAATLTALHVANIRIDVGDVPGTSQKQIFLSDPAGNGVELNFSA